MANNPNLWRTDVRAYVVIAGKKYPISYGETLYRLDDIPVGYVEIPLGRKVKSAKGGSSDTPDTIDTAWLSNLPPLTPAQIMLKCTAVGPKPPHLGYHSGEFMTVFDGYIVSPWIRKRRGGTAVASITILAQIMKLAVSAPYTQTMQPDFVGGKSVISMRVGQIDRASHTATAALINTLKRPSERVVRSIKDLFDIMVSEAAKSPARQNGINTEGGLAVKRLDPSVGSMNPAETNPPPAGFSILHGVGDVGDKGKNFQENLDCSVARAIADVAYTDWASGPQDGGGDLWNVLTKLARLFMFSIVATPGSKDYIVPLAYGTSQEPFKTIGPNEFWGTEIGKTFTMRDYGYVTACYLNAPMMSATPSPGTSNEFSVPNVGQASLNIPKETHGRTSFLECPSWAVTPTDLTPDFIAQGKDLPDRAALDNKDHKPSPQNHSYWADTKLGDLIAYHGCAFQTFNHRVLSFVGRLRYDIAPGSLCRILHNEDLFVQKSSGKKAAYYGILVEARTTFGGNSGSSKADTTMTFSHVHNEMERGYWEGHNTHPVYGETFYGVPLVSGVE